MKLQSLKNQMDSDVAYMDRWVRANQICEKDFEKARTHFIVMRAKYNYQMRLLWLTELKNKITYAK